MSEASVSRIGVAERRWLWLASVRRRLVQRRSPLGCKPRAVVALRGALAAGVGPLPWYSERVGWGFLPILSVLIWPENGKGLGILLDPF